MGGGADEGWAKIMKLAKGPGMINLGQGFPDFVPELVSKVIRPAAQKSIDSVPECQYSPMRGHGRLRKAIVSLRWALYGEDIDEENVCVVCSGTEAIFATIQALVNPGDEVVLFEPFFPWYLAAIRMAGGKAVVIELKPPLFAIQNDDVERAFSTNTKLCILNSPHNPTGHMVNTKELDIIAKFCAKFDALLVSDEVYEVCSFDPKQRSHLTASQHSEDMRKRTLTLGSASKLLSLTGWRVGWVSGPAELVSAVSAAHSYMTFCAPTPLQIGIAAGIECAIGSEKDSRDREKAPSTPLEITKAFGDLGGVFYTNWTILSKAIESIGLKVCKAEGGYFLICDVSVSGLTDMEFCTWLMKTHKIVGIPLSLFYAEPKKTDRYLVRFAVCKTRKAIERAAAAMSKVDIGVAKAPAKGA